MVGVVLKGLWQIGKFAFKRPLLTVGGGLLADQALTGGKGRGLAYNKVIKPTANAAFETASEVAQKGVQKVTDNTLGGIGNFFKNIGFGPLLAFGSGMLFSGGGIMQKMIFGIAMAAVTYGIQKLFFKDDFNQAAKNSGPDHSLEANANPNKSPVAAEFQEKGTEMPTHAERNVTVPKSIGSTAKNDVETELELHNE